MSPISQLSQSQPTGSSISNPQPRTLSFDYDRPLCYWNGAFSSHPAVLVLPLSGLMHQYGSRQSRSFPLGPTHSRSVRTWSRAFSLQSPPSLAIKRRRNRRTEPAAFYLNVYFNILPMMPTDLALRPKPTNELVHSVLPYSGDRTEFIVDMTIEV